jgi:hypothetical protein
VLEINSGVTNFQFCDLQAETLLGFLLVTAEVVNFILFGIMTGLWIKYSMAGVEEF